VLPDEVATLAAERPDVDIVAGDVREAADCWRLCAGARDAVLLHLAGVIHPRRVRDFYDVNVHGTEGVLAAAATAGVRRAVVMSSNSPLGCNPHPDHRFDEESPYHPYRHYGRSKMLLEARAREVERATGMETVIVRAPWFYGPHQPPRQTEFFAMVQDGRAPIVGGGTARRSMTYVGNLAQGLFLAATTPAAAGRLYWIADERPYTMSEIVDTVERLLETEFDRPCAHRRLRLPGVVSELAGGVDAALQAVGLYHAKVHVLSEMSKTIACSIERARRELGYVPTVALEEGMRRSLRWLDEKGLLPPRRR
jgi:nucleoside-diphosphate-sugar epimerase